MRLDLPRLKERFGGVLFYGLQSVYELDSGLVKDESSDFKGEVTQRFPYERLHHHLSSMAIIVPVREERLKLLDGVLAGIPHPCQIILVSNSSRQPIDRFHMEHDVSQTFGLYTNRPIIAVHQQDPKIAKALEKAGYGDILEDGLVRSGKAEGMMLGILLAKLAGCKTVGFVDSDNYFPGAVLEYCRLFAAGFAMSKQHDHTMVRIAWYSKPKIIRDNLFFAKWGRSSVITNAYLNQLVSNYTGFEIEAIRTGNAGEHAMDINLAMEIGHSTGYSIEPYQLIYMMEHFGGIELSNNTPSKIKSKMVDIFQVESRNPHLHEQKGDEHVQRMIEASLSVIYYSTLASDDIKQDIKRELAQRDILPLDKPVPQLRQYPPLNKINMELFREMLDKGGYLKQLGFAKK